MINFDETTTQAERLDAYRIEIANLRVQLAEEKAVLDKLANDYYVLKLLFAERDAQLAAADKLLSRTVNATTHVVRHDNLRRDIHAYQRTHKPKEGT